MYLPFVLLLQWFSLGFHYRGGTILYGQLLVVVTETGPQSWMFPVGSITGQACLLQRQRTPSKGWTLSDGLAAVLRAFVHVDRRNSPVGAAPTVRPCVLVLLTRLQEVGPMLTAVWCCSQLVLILVFPSGGMCNWKCGCSWPSG